MPTQLSYYDIVNSETFCYGDVLFQRHFVPGDVLLRRHFVMETFCIGRFCRGDVLNVRLADILYFILTSYLVQYVKYNNYR
jgi:hypothetical protein